MENKQPTKENSSINLISGIAGGCVGALLIVLSRQLAEPYAPIPLYLSPFLAIVSAIFWKNLGDKIARRARMKNFEATVSEAFRFIEASLKDNLLTKQRKNELKEFYQKLNRLREKKIFQDFENPELEEELSHILEKLEAESPAKTSITADDTAKKVLKKELKNIVSEADYEKVIDLLKVHIKDKNNSNTLISVAAQFNQIEKDYHKATIDEKEKASRLARISQTLLNLIDTIKDE